MAIKFLNALNIDGTVTATINQDANDGYDGILVSTSGLIERRTKAQILADIGAGTLSSFTVSADTNTVATSITASSNTLTIKGGTGVSTVSDPDGTITINASGSSYTKWVLAGDSGTAEDVNDGDTATWNGVNGIVTEVKSGRILEVGFPIASLSAGTVAGGDFVAIADIDGSNAIKKVTAQSIADLAPQGDITAVEANSTDDNRLGIAVVDSTGPVPKVGLDIVGLSAVVTGADDDLLAVYDLDVTKNKSISLSKIKSYIGAITSVGSGSGIKVTTTGSTATVNVDYTSTGIVADANAAGSITLADGDTILLQDADGTAANAVKSIPLSLVKTYIGGDNYGSWTLSDGTTTQTIGSGDTVTVSGDAANAADAGITPVVSATDTLTLKLDLEQVQNITALDDADSDELIYYDTNNEQNQRIAVSNIHLNEFGAPTAALSIGSQKLTDVANGVLASDGVNLAQVESLVAGTSLFRGGYNATTGSTTDLGAGNGSINGASNIATGIGDFYAVTVAGTQLGVALEVGDLIFANVAITASSNPPNSSFTIVQSGQSIAAAGATDSATVKGVAGFDSAVFTATVNGWIQLIDQSITAQSYGSAAKTVTIEFDKYGVAQSASDQNIDISASQVNDFCTAVSTCIGANEQYTETVGGAISITVQHDLGTRDVIVQLYDLTNYDTVYADVVRTDNNNIDLSFTTAPSANNIRVMITKVS